MKSPSIKQLSDFSQAMSKRDPRLDKAINRHFQGTITSVSPLKGSGFPFLVQINRTEGPDGNTYICAIPGYFPQIGDLVECEWRGAEPTVGYVKYPLSLGSLTSPVGAAIATTAVSVASLSVVVPNGFHFLRVYGMVRSDTANASTDAKIRYNGDSSGIYHSLIQGADGATTIGPSQVLNDIYAEIGMSPVNGDTSNVFGSFEVVMENYGNTSMHKTALYRGGFFSSGGGRWRFGVHTWQSLSAVTSVTILAAAGNLVAGSRLEIEVK